MIPTLNIVAWSSVVPKVREQEDIAPLTRTTPGNGLDPPADKSQRSRTPAPLTWSSIIMVCQFIRVETTTHRRGARPRAVA